MCCCISIDRHETIFLKASRYLFAPRLFGLECSYMSIELFIYDKDGRFVTKKN